MVQTYIYSTASNVAAFINGYHIEQAYGFNYKESIPKVPIYGYNDYEFSKVVRGKGIIQGILVINFIFPGYLTPVLEHKKDPYVGRLYNYNMINKSKSTRVKYEEIIFNELQTELPANTSIDSKKARAEYIAKLISPKNDQEALEATKNSLFEHLGLSSDNEKKRPEKESVSNPLLVEATSTYGDQVDIYYQDPELSTWFVRFNNVHFTEVSQNISQAGAEGSSEPLYEIYEFIAQNREIKLIK
jgi:hypothetical protein